MSTPRFRWLIAAKVGPPSGGPHRGLPPRFPSAFPRFPRPAYGLTMEAGRVSASSDQDRLLERSAELAVLRDSLAAVSAHRGGRLVQVAGEAGVGKTALL